MSRIGKNSHFHLRDKDVEKSENPKNDRNADRLVELLSGYDVISFDLFDTLITRPYDSPQELFSVVGEQLGAVDFKKKRIEAEILAREKRFRISSGTRDSGIKRIFLRLRNKICVSVGGTQVGDYEVTLAEIWAELSTLVGVPAKEGMRAEIEVEERLCKAIPAMQIVWNRLLAQRKRLVILTDMYLPQEVLEQILAHNEYAGFERLMVSNTYRKSKADGSLYEELKAAYPGSKIVHVGDDPVSDVRNAKRHGTAAIRI